MLTSYAGVATRNKVGTRAKEAYEEILRYYDTEHIATRRALGFKKDRRTKTWKPPRRPKEWLDKANDDQRYKVTLEWHKTRMKLADVHRKHGITIFDGDRKLGIWHLERAIRFSPFDEEAHLKLGHKKGTFGEDTYYGTAKQLEFIGNLKRLETHALVLAKKDYPVKPVDVIPTELAVLEKEFHGAKSKHFTVFTRGTQENANNCVKWAERGLEFLQFALGEDRTAEFFVVERQARYAWRGFVWTKYEKDELITKNLQRNRDSAFVKEISKDQAALKEKLFGNIQWWEKGQEREIDKSLTPAIQHDRLVAHVWELGIGVGSQDYDVNFPLAEGALHAATWYLLSTAMSKRGSLATGTAASREVELPKSVNWWMREMRDQAIAHTDIPVREVARQVSSKFPNRARLKTWSFMTWLMARYPEKWQEFIITVPGAKIPFPEEVDKAAVEVFERKLEDIEAEWREWASGRSITAAATGYGPPLLPAVPNPEQVAGLRRLNELRAQLGLPACELDLEATQACVEHARYLLKYPDHWKWPEAHEQNPARAGFTPRGMRAGLRSVIVIHARDAAKSVDRWFGTVYHRFPLLAENIRRIGFAFEGDMCVLDMGSLEEPHKVDKDGKSLEKKWMIWPPDGAKKVDRQFAFYEFPNPLGDVAPPNNRDDEAGYPVSLTMAHYVHPQVIDADIHLYEAKKRGKGFKRGKEVTIHKHTPQEPLLSRNETLDTVFGIPLRPLEKNTIYQVVVNLKLKAGTDTVEWTFTTGGMGLKKGTQK